MTAVRAGWLSIRRPQIFAGDRHCLVAEDVFDVARNGVCLSLISAEACCR